MLSGFCDGSDYCLRTNKSKSMYPYFKQAKRPTVVGSWFLTGYYISLVGVSLILVWLGSFKFTPTEAHAIQPLIESHPFMSWLYLFLSTQDVSNVIGAVEITTGIFILCAPFHRFFRVFAGVAIFITFATTLSFLFTIHSSWRVVDGVPVVDFFILKDFVFLGFGLMIFQLPRSLTYN